MSEQVQLQEIYSNNETHDFWKYIGRIGLQNEKKKRGFRWKWLTPMTMCLLILRISFYFRKQVMKTYIAIRQT